ncbi:disulfide bond corrector protein DsbC [Rhodovulum bhavnagarense]|uniref:Disulfide bond corrector protein DsbC n=1 Tax=Rhodovulum bhavnagarense TaxID=992286 RepID=A0A4R2RUP8_9RHOB|nr:protein-disulfide reductase DsbD domain-containing protein [Rhodovulum bhavnagarense]TCP62865.1 disulfide bond corrector protein DsbC [Rhodovulum bhavnagarense]
MTCIRNRTLVAAAALVVLVAQPRLAGAADDQILNAEILPGWQTASGTYMAGLRLDLAPGWKTYWRAPGDAGIPPRFDWSGSDNLADVQVHWPRPKLFSNNDMRTIGYETQVVLPVELTPARPGEPIALRARIELGVCHDICMPMDLDLAAPLPAAGTGRQQAPIRAALAARPMPGDQAQVGEVLCAVEPISDGIRLTAKIDVPELGDGEAAVFELGDPSIWVSEAQTLRAGQTMVAHADLVPVSGRPFELDRASVRITLLSTEQAIDIRGCAGDQPARPARPIASAAAE